MRNIIIDLHCHSQMKAYCQSFSANGVPKHTNVLDPSKKNSAWWTDWPTARDIRKNTNGLLGLTQFTQADMLTCLRGNVGLTFSSLYPLERGFTLPFKKNGNLVDKIIDKITQFGKPRIDYTQGIQDYFPDLEQEYQFQLTNNGKVATINGKKYSYQFVNNYEELVNLLEQPDDGVERMAVINSIEGAHCFGTGLEPYQLPQNIDEVLARIKKVKGWDYPPFFITLAHHFYNEICGHAKSLGLAGIVLCQKKGLNAGFTPEGERILRALLDDTEGRRTLIDIKHMSVPARKRYYEILDQEYCNEVPIVVSHGCVTGYADQVNGKDQRSVVEGSPEKKFCSDDINFYDFEILKIKQSDGIFGIQLDERRIGSRKEKRKAKRVEPRKMLYYSSKMVWNQIQHIAEVLDHHGYFAWDIQSIGSDFDGIINPIDGFFTAMHFENLSHFLLMHAHNYCNTQMDRRIKHDFNRIDCEEIIDRFFQENALEFLRKHFRG